jgi:asparaginyl-tRNA synthetase
MMFISVSKILSGYKGKVSIRGWLHNKRSLGSVLFLIVRDGTGFIQCVLKKDTINESIIKEIDKLNVESVLEIHGTSRIDKRAPGGYEILVENVKVLHRAENGFPIAKKYHGPSFLLDNRHLWIRSRKMFMILKIRAKIIEAARDWFRNNEFVEFHAPILTSTACEGGATLFPVNYFGKTVYLTQSWQLYAEAGIASLGKIYTIAPSFRAEKSKTRRHLTEYWHLEAEIPFCDFECLLNIEEQLITYMLHRVAEDSYDILKSLGRNPEDLLRIKPPFPRITYDKAIEILKRDGVQINWGDDLTWITEKKLALKFITPFFITHFPKHIKAFYHKVDPARPEVTLSADLLAPEGYGEIIGSGQRIDDVNELMQRINENNLNPNDYYWYIDLRKWGAIPHSGFGLGIERTVMWICKLKHIRDAIAFPRLINRVHP